MAADDRTLKSDPDNDEAQCIHGIYGVGDAVWTITTDGVTVRRTKRNPADQINSIIRLALHVAATRAANDAKQGVRDSVYHWVNARSIDVVEIDEMVELLFMDFANAVLSMLEPRSDSPAGHISEGEQ